MHMPLPRQGSVPPLHLVVGRSIGPEFQKRNLLVSTLGKEGGGPWVDLVRTSHLQCASCVYAIWKREFLEYGIIQSGGCRPILWAFSSQIVRIVAVLSRRLQLPRIGWRLILLDLMASGCLTIPSIPFTSCVGGRGDGCQHVGCQKQASRKPRLVSNCGGAALWLEKVACKRTRL